MENNTEKMQQKKMQDVIPPCMLMIVSYYDKSSYDKVKHD